MAEDRENYCRLIGLNPNQEKSCSTESVNGRIANLEKRWNKEFKDKQNDLDRRFRAHRSLGMLPDVRRVMADPALRAQEFAAGRRLLASKASKLNKDTVILRDGTRVLLPGAADALLKRLAWDGVKKGDLIAASKLDDAPFRSAFDPVMLNAYAGVAAVGAYTPVEVLNALIGDPGLELDIPILREHAPLSSIREAFEACERRVANVKQDVLPAQDSYIQTLRAIKTVLDDDDKLTQLNRYGTCMKALVPVTESMDEDYGQPFTREYIDSLLKIHAGDADTGLALSILEEHCYRKRYAANFSARDSRLVICPACLGMTDAGDGAVRCSLCGHGIRTRCPSCNTEQASDNRACIKCGFDFREGLRRAEELSASIGADLERGAVRAAEASLAELRRVYATYPGINDLNRRTTAAATELDNIAAGIAGAYRMRKFRGCRMSGEAALGRFPGILDDAELKNMYEESVRRVMDAEGICALAEAEADPEARMALYVSAAGKCPDHPEVLAKLSGYPPASPADAVFQTRDEDVLIKFAVPEDRRGMTFCIYRERGRLPTVDGFTEPLTEIQNSVYLDKNPAPGVAHYYSVYSRRHGILSREAASCGPVTVYAEVDEVSIEPVEGGLRLAYVKPRGCSRVRIWRKEGVSEAGAGDEVEVIHGGEVPFNDYGLKGGVRYYYLFVAEYDDDGRIERSAGAAFSGTTADFPKPVREIEVRRNDSDGSFTARWDSRDEVALYSSPKKVNMFGRTVELADLRSWMEEIRPMESYADGMRFMLPEESVHYLYPMIHVGKVAVRGKMFIIANLKPFRDIETRIDGGDCDITVSWPDDAEAMVVMIKDDAVAGGPDDITAERITVSRESYAADRMVRIPLGNARKRVATLFAQYEVDGKAMHSRGVGVNIYSGNYRKVRYAVRTEKAGKETRLSVEVETDADVEALPALQAVAVTAGIPLRRTDGIGVWESGSELRLTDGKATAAFAVGADVDPARMRLFFADDEDYHGFRFIHPLPGGR